MIIYPAIDLKDGDCVRLVRGDMNQATVFARDPAKRAREFEKQGFQWLHLVDLNGAMEGKSVNTLTISGIIENVTIPVQLGGGIRTMKQIEDWLKVGVTRVILGTKALHEPEFVKVACREFPDKIVVGIDANEGRVAVSGWGEVSDVKATDLALKFEDAGVVAIIYTDIQRDGTLQGPNIEETVKLAESLTTPVILSGGISGAEDLRNVREAGIGGVVVGRAMYEHKFTPEEALTIAAGR